jgi:Rrf2 family iron-sulfur cluster assembly transcriptional regulator
MRLSKKGRYGVRAMVCLALQSRGFPLSIKKIAAQENIPLAFLEQLFFKLKKAGLVKSRRGPGGGFMLCKSPEKIRALDIIEALGETLEPAECVADNDGVLRCKQVDRCASHLLWEELGKRMREVLEGTTIEDMCRMARGLQSGEYPKHSHTFHI